MKSVKTVVVAGPMRSGTTWVGEVLNGSGFYKVLLDPFYRPDLGRDFPEVFQVYQYIRKNTPGPEYREVVERLLYGDGTDNNGPLYYNDGQPIYSSLRGLQDVDWRTRSIVTRQGILLKETKCNFFLPWFQTQFPDASIILLLRHPCAVALSRKLLKIKNYLHLFIAQSDLVADHLPIDLINFINSEIKNSVGQWSSDIIAWCLETLVPLRGLDLSRVRVKFYEDLCTEPQVNFAELISFIGHSFLPDYSRPSVTSSASSSIKTGKDLVSEWKSQVSDDCIKKATEILKRFGLDFLYGEDAYPTCVDPSAIKSHLGGNYS